MKNNYFLGFLFAIMLLSVGLVSASTEVTYRNLDIQKDFCFYGECGATAEIEIIVSNTGSTHETGIVELAWMNDKNVLSFVTPQVTCDSSTPENVHRWYELSAGETTRFTLLSEAREQGSFDLVLTHANNCATGDNSFQTFECKESIGCEFKIADVVVGDEKANNLDECNTDFQALETVRAKGDPSCAVASCIDKSSSESIAVCISKGVCETGSVQHDVCDSSQAPIIVRVCNNAAWEETGLSCEGGLPSEPSNNGLLYFTIGFIVLLAAVIYWVIFK